MKSKLQSPKGSIDHKNLLKLMSNLLDFCKILSGDLNSLIEFYNKDEWALLIAFLTFSNPLLEPEISELFFAKINEKIPGRFSDEIQSTVKFMVMNKRDAHLMIQDLLRLKYFSAAFHIGKLCFFSNRLFPKTTQSAFGNKQYMAHLADILLEHLIQLQVDFGIFMGYYDYTYNFTDRLDVQLLLKIFLANLGHPELASYSRQHKVLRKILDKALYEYISQITPSKNKYSEKNIFEYVQPKLYKESRLSKHQLPSNTLEIPASSLFIHLAFCRDTEISNLLTEIILSRKNLFESGFVEKTLALMGCIMKQYNTPHSMLMSEGPFKQKLNEYDRLETGETIDTFNLDINSDILLGQFGNNLDPINQNFSWIFEISRLKTENRKGTLDIRNFMSRVSRLWSQFGTNDLLIALYLLLTFDEIFESRHKELTSGNLLVDSEDFLMKLEEWKGYFQLLPNFNLIEEKIDSISKIVLLNPDLDSF